MSDFSENGLGAILAAVCEFMPHFMRCFLFSFCLHHVHPQLWQLTKTKERVDEINSVAAAVCSHCCLLLELFLNGAALNYTAAVSSLGVLSSLFFQLTTVIL